MNVTPIRKVSQKTPTMKKRSIAINYVKLNAVKIDTKELSTHFNTEIGMWVILLPDAKNNILMNEYQFQTVFQLTN